MSKKIINKMRKGFIWVSLILVPLFLTVSCGEEETDTGFNTNNLTSNRWRIENLTYEVSGASINIIELMRGQKVEPVIYMTFNSDNTYEIDDAFELFTSAGFSTEGEWEISGDDNEILTIQSTDSVGTVESIDLTITNLTKTDFECYNVTNTTGMDFSELLDPTMAAMITDKDITLKFDFRAEN